MLNSDGTAFNTNGLGKQRQRLMEGEGVDFGALGSLLGFASTTRRPNDPTLPLRGDHADQGAVPRVDVTPADVRPMLRSDVIAAFAEFGLSEESVVQYIVEHHNDRSQQRYLADLEGLTRKHGATLNSTDVMLIDLYTTKLFYKELNTRLRTGENRDAALKLAKLLNISLSKLPEVNAPAYRSIKIKEDGLADFLAKHAKGKDIEWDSYSSVASDLAGTFHKDNIVFVVNNATAYDITDFADGMAYKETPNPGRELLIPAGAKLKVVDVKEVSPGKYHIILDQTASGAL
jgi:hypothetical protein